MKHFQWKRGLRRLLIVASVCWAIAVSIILCSDWQTPNAHDEGVTLNLETAQPIQSKSLSASPDKIDISSGMLVGSEGLDCYDRTGRLLPNEAAKFNGIVTQCAPDEYEVPHGHKIGLPTRWERWHGKDIGVLLVFVFVPILTSFALLHSLSWAVAGFKTIDPAN